jgi:hypothetical protein
MPRIIVEKMFRVLENMRKINVYRVFEGEPEGKRPLGRYVRRIILKWILEKLDGIVRSGLIWLKLGYNGELL